MDDPENDAVDAQKCPRELDTMMVDTCTYGTTIQTIQWFKESKKGSKRGKHSPEDG